MLVRPFTKEDREPWQQRYRQTDPIMGREFYLERCPKVGDMVPVETTQELVDAGFAETLRLPVICKNAEDEREVKKLLGLDVTQPTAEAVIIPFAESPIEKLKRENAELEALLAKNNQLKGELAGEKPAPVKQQRRRRKRRGPPARPKTLEEFAKA